MKLGVIGTSNKENEKRVPIHPAHFSRLPNQVRRQLFFEEGYGEPFGLSDSEIASQTGGTATRNELLGDFEAVVLLKPVVEDFAARRERGILWGWPHCVQQRALTQAAIDRRQTLIAFEEMHAWGPDGLAGRHTFYKNNELAGYCAVLHALQLKGADGHYGDQRKTVILGFGATSRGAIYALKARGYRDITICTQRPDHEVRQEVLDCHYLGMRPGGAGEARLLQVEHDGTKRPLAELLGEASIIVNGTLQDPEHPLMFITQQERSVLGKGCLIIDVSCDEGMGFHFATPTSFNEPMLKFGTVDYYAVDHTPSYLWESASRSISAALLMHLPTVMAGRATWDQDETIRRAVVIDNGVVQDSRILAYQRRQTRYPHTSSAN